MINLVWLLVLMIITIIGLFYLTHYIKKESVEEVEVIRVYRVDKKTLMILLIFVAMAGSYTLGIRTGFYTHSGTQLPERGMVYTVLSPTFQCGTNTCVVLQPITLTVSTMTWEAQNKSWVYSVQDTFTNAPQTRVVGILSPDGTGKVELRTHPLLPPDVSTFN